MGLSRMAVFEDCQAIPLTTRPRYLVVLLFIYFEKLPKSLRRAFDSSSRICSLLHLIQIISVLSTNIPLA